MPQFNGQNKKKIDPRYFSEELLEEVLDPERATGPLDPEKDPWMGPDRKDRRLKRTIPIARALRAPGDQNYTPKDQPLVRFRAFFLKPLVLWQNQKSYPRPIFALCWVVAKLTVKLGRRH